MIFKKGTQSLSTLVVGINKENYGSYFGNINFTWLNCIVNTIIIIIIILLHFIFKSLTERWETYKSWDKTYRKDVNKFITSCNQSQHAYQLCAHHLC